MKASELAEFFAAISGAYPRQQVTNETAKAYARMLADLDFADAMRALDEHVAESQFFPAISDIRQRAAKRRAACPGPEEAWAEVMRMVGKYGSRGVPRAPSEGGGYVPVSFTHPAIDAAVAGVGWDAICMSDTIGVERGHFLRMYQSASERVVREQNTGRLLGGGGQGQLEP